MIEIRFQGRGGQGVVIASETFARACFEANMYPQCYSVFGGERRGAPVAAYVRISDRKIHLKCDIEKPNHLVIFDPSLFSEREIAEQVVKGGTLLINAEEVQMSDILREYKVGKINAFEISRRNGLGSILNTAVLGAYVGLTKIVDLPVLLNSIRQSIPAEVEKNMEAAKEGYEKVALL
jgi:2-oxoacid:acceptor oxidoreductase gamma subunit (pyruvate/2-ketoisovalerate family)